MNINLFSAIICVIILVISPEITACEKGDSDKLLIKIDNIKQEKGNVILELFYSDYSGDLDKPLDTPIQTKVLPVKSTGEVEFLFDEFKQGLYAVVAFHDINKNGKADFSWFSGREPVVISNLLSQPMSAPDFSDAAFDVSQEGICVSFSLYD